MTPIKNFPVKAGVSRKEKLDLILFVAGSEPNSLLSQKNLKRICTEHFFDCHSIEIIDVFRDIGAALKYNIIITPTLIKVMPKPVVTVYGNLSDTSKVLASLQIEE